MSKPASKKALDAQAKAVAKHDSKFVAKLAGQKWKNIGASEELSSSRPSSSSRSAKHQFRPQQSAAGGHAAAYTADAGLEQQQQQPQQHEEVPPSPANDSRASIARSKQRATSPLHCVSPEFDPPDSRPAWLKAVDAVNADAVASWTAEDSGQVHTAAAGVAGSTATGEPAGALTEASLGSSWQRHHHVSSTHGGADQAQAACVQEQVQQAVARAWLDSRTQQHAGHCSPSPAIAASRAASPSWWLKASAAGSWVQPGPVQVESSLYCNWAETFIAADPATADGRVVSAPAASAAAAITIAGKSLAEALDAPGSSMPPPLQEPSAEGAASKISTGAAAAAAVTARTGAGGAMAAAAAAAAAARTGISPCSSNFCSSRAAGLVAGISRPGMNLKYQAWLKGQYPGAKPPRREDAESVRAWLQQQLEHLQQQLQQELGKPPPSLADSCNQQHMQQAAQQILESMRPQNLLAIHQQQQLQQLQPDWRQRAASPAAPETGGMAAGRGSEHDTDVAVGRWHDAGLEAQTSQLLLMGRQPSGGLDVERLQQQEAIYTAVFNELCRQVSVQCVERGHLMAQLWLAIRAMVLAALDDRHTARASETAAHAATAAARQEADRLQQLQEDERVALRAICERHAAKADAAKQELDKCQKTNDQLQDLLQRLSAAQQLVQRVMDLEAVNQQQQTTISTLQQQLLSSEQRAGELSSELAAWQARGSKAEQQVAELQQQLRVSTPRPQRDLGLLSDLLTPEESLLVEQALITGLPAEHVHRLLLGLSTDGDDMRPWMELAGCCLAALQSAADPLQLHQQLRQLLASCDAAGLSRLVDPAASIHIIGQAVHVCTATDMILQLMDGSLGLPCTASQLAAAAAKVAASSAATAVGAGAATAMDMTGQDRNGRRSESPGDREAQQQAVQASVKVGGADPGQAAAAATTQGQVSSACKPQAGSGGGGSGSQPRSLPSNPSQRLRVQQLMACIGIGMPYRSLVGVLATKYGHDANELGGPVTEALVHAQLSTNARVQELEAKARAMHREVVLLKRTLAEQRKHEQERIDTALKDQKRKIARREQRQPSLIDKFLQTKWGDYFIGIGLMEDLPRVLRANVPVNNKRMPKRDAEKLAREIWQAKDETEALPGVPRQHLPDVTAAFLERRYFAIPRLITEVAYNFIYSLGQHSYDADCNLFLRVFTGEVEEAVRHEQQALEGEIMKLLKLLDVSINHQATGWLHKADVKTALAGFFKGKSVDRLSELYEALDTDEPGDALHYPGLFSDDDDLNQGMTAETIRSQHLQERLEYLQEVEDSIRDAAEDNQTTSLTPAMLRSCLEKLSRKMEPATLDAFVSRAFGPDWERQQHRLAQPLGQVIRAIRRGSLQPALRPTAATAATAVSKIAPVGKFKTKLMSALKVGLNEPGGSRLTSNNTGAAAGTWGEAGRNTARQRSTNELAALGGAAAAAAAGAASTGNFAAIRSRRATADAVSAAVAAVLAGGGNGPKQRTRQLQTPASSGAILGGTTSTDDISTAGSAAAAAATGDGNPAVEAGSTSSATDTLQQLATVQLSEQQSGAADMQQQQQQQQPGAQQLAAISSEATKSSSTGQCQQEQQQQQQQVSLILRLSGSFKAPLQGDGSGSSSSNGSGLPAIRSSSSGDGGRESLPRSSTVKIASPDALARSPETSNSGGKGDRSSGATSSVFKAAAAAAAANTSSRLSAVASHSSAAASAALQPGMTVGMLSAMEAVRQSWLKEEEEKLFQAPTPGAAAGATGGSMASSRNGKAAASRASVASFFLGSSSGERDATCSSSPSFRGTDSAAAAVAGADEAALGSDAAGCSPAGAGTQLSFYGGSSSGGYRTGAPFKIPDIPALRLDALFEDGCGGAGSARKTATGRSARSTRAEPGSLSSRSGLRPAMGRQDSAQLCPDSAKSFKRVQISVDVEAEGAGVSSPPRSPSLAVQRSQLSAAWGQYGEVGSPAAAAAAAGANMLTEGSNVLNSPRLSPGRGNEGTHGPAAGRLEGGTAGGAGSRSLKSRNASIRLSASSSIKKPPMLLLTDADDAIVASVHSNNGSTRWPAQLTVGFAENVACNAADSDGDDVCFTPSAPAVGGKMNAVMMRKLAKGKSLQRLEEVMLMVASQGAEAAGVEWE